MCVLCLCAYSADLDLLVVNIMHGMVKIRYFHSFMSLNNVTNRDMYLPSSMLL